MSTSVGPTSLQQPAATYRAFLAKREAWVVYIHLPAVRIQIIGWAVSG